MTHDSNTSWQTTNQQSTSILICWRQASLMMKLLIFSPIYWLVLLIKMICCSLLRDCWRATTSIKLMSTSSTNRKLRWNKSSTTNLCNPYWNHLPWQKKMGLSSRSSLDSKCKKSTCWTLSIKTLTRLSTVRKQSLTYLRLLNMRT